MEESGGEEAKRAGEGRDPRQGCPWPLGVGWLEEQWGHTIWSSALVWSPELPRTPSPQLSASAMSTLPYGRLSQKGPVGQGSLYLCGVPASPLLAPHQSRDQSVRRPPKGSPSFLAYPLPCRGPEGRGCPSSGVPVDLSPEKGVCTGSVLPIDTHVCWTAAVMPSLPKTHNLTPRCAHPSTHRKQLKRPGPQPQTQRHTLSLSVTLGRCQF